MSSLPTSQRCWAYDYERLEPKGTWSGAGVLRSPVAVVAPPAEWQDLPHTGIRVERDKLIIFPMGRTIARPTDEIVDKGGWKKRMPYCNDMDISIVKSIRKCIGGSLCQGVPLRCLSLLR